MNKLKTYSKYLILAIIIIISSGLLYITAYNYFEKNQIKKLPITSDDIIENIEVNQQSSSLIPKPQKLPTAKEIYKLAKLEDIAKVENKYFKSGIFEDIISSNLEEGGFNMGNLSGQNIAELGAKIPFEINLEQLKQSLEKRESLESDEKAQEANENNKKLADLVPIPENCEKQNWLSYPKYGVEAPIQHASLQDFFVADQDGHVNLNNPIQEDPQEIARGNYESVPIQRILKAGVAHLGFSPRPGEIGNSYIVGHTSNFSSVISNYNTIFKPLERRTQNGEEFFIWDHKCRKLKFITFENLAILEADTDTAYKTFGDRRVITLQGSILERVNGFLQPTKRWLTRGELVID